MSREWEQPSTYTVAQERSLNLFASVSPSAKQGKNKS